MTHRISVIGSGFAGISTAAFLARSGNEVHVYEKHDVPGGRARQYRADGFVFDMGPSWYWMPDVFERFFQAFGKSPDDYYSLKKLDPSFTIFFGEHDIMDVPAGYAELRQMFEDREPGSSKKLDRFMTEAAYKYDVGIAELVYRPSISWLEFIQWKLMTGVVRLDVFKSLRKHVRGMFKDPGLVALMEFPVLFLGGAPQDTPALYSLMNYAGLKLGTWYPMGGFGSVVQAMKQVAEEQGAQFHMNTPVEQIDTDGKRATGITVGARSISTDAVVATADYSYVELSLLPEELRSYSEEYWNSRTMAPSCLIFYLGIDRKIEGLRHHNLFFDESLDNHAREIYSDPVWPEKPLFYACCPSKTDPGVAPEGYENLFLLMPIAPGLKDTPEMRRKYYEIMLRRLHKYIGFPVAEHIVYSRSYCVEDFVNDYHALKGNAYGLANTLRQTAVLRPSVRSKKIENLFYAGHLTVPGPGVPPAIISGEVTAKYLMKKFPIAS